MNEIKQTWKCPICRQIVQFEDIEVDEYFLKILQSSILSKYCANVILLEDFLRNYLKQITILNQYKDHHLMMSIILLH